MSIAQQLMPIYNTTVYKNKVNVALNVVKCLEFMKTPTGHKGGNIPQILRKVIKERVAFTDLTDISCLVPLQKLLLKEYLAFKLI